MGKNLVIVESPAKAKTIEGYLGSDYVVRSSYGHIRDLPGGKLAVDVENGFMPTYELTADKGRFSELKKLAKSAEVVWLATDEDREGEAISWHLMEALGLKPEQTKRIVFSEITKPAILRAIEHPRQVDLDLVNAQQARRALDHLVGFNLSPLLWKKIKTGLSAGRVQSPALRMIVEREREIEAFEPQEYWTIEADMGHRDREFRSRLVRLENDRLRQFDITTADHAHRVRDRLKRAAAPALEALRSFAAWMESELLPRSTRSPAWSVEQIDFTECLLRRHVSGSAHDAAVPRVGANIAAGVVTARTAPRLNHRCIAVLLERFLFVCRSTSAKYLGQAPIHDLNFTKGKMSSPRSRSSYKPSFKTAPKAFQKRS